MSRRMMMAMIASQPKGLPLSELPEGTLVKIREKKTATNFVIMKNDYQADVNGKGRKLLARQSSWDVSQWGNRNDGSVYYNTSDIDRKLRTEYLPKLHQSVRDMMGMTKIKSILAKGSPATVIERAVFLPSRTEVIGGSTKPIEGEKIPLFETVLRPKWTTYVWTRSRDEALFIPAVWYVNKDSFGPMPMNKTCAMVPCFTLPETALVNPTQNPDGSYTLIE